MTTATYIRFAGKTGRPLGWADVISKAYEIVRQSASHWFNAVRAPQPGRADTATEEANRVRRMAASCLRHDPGFAADLYAAADRHEQMAGR